MIVVVVVVVVLTIRIITEAQLWTAVTDNANNFAAWTSLIAEAEKSVCHYKLHTHWRERVKIGD
jgi:hypothetical protein